MGFDGSSVRGFAEINESDLMLIADKSTIRSLTSNVTMIPGYKVTSVIADVYRGFGQGRLSKDPRYVSGCIEDHLKQKGLVCQIGAEVECFIFDDIAFNDLKDNEEPKLYLWNIMDRANIRYAQKRDTMFHHFKILYQHFDLK